MTISINPVLTLAQWFSPAFPVGAFHFSQGLEWEMTHGTVKDADTLEQWLKDMLHRGAARNDAILLACAYKGVPKTDETARALAPSLERLQETLEMGAAFTRIVNTLNQSETEPLCYPVALGHAAKARALPLELTLEMFLQSWLSNLIAVAQRLGPIGQTKGQEILQRLTSLCSQIAQEAAQSTLDDLGASTFAADIASMQHETQYARIFRT